MRRSDPFLAKKLNNTYSKTNDGESVLGKGVCVLFFCCCQGGGQSKILQSKAKRANSENAGIDRITVFLCVVIWVVKIKRQKKGGAVMMMKGEGVEMSELWMMKKRKGGWLL